jgi:nucleotide-binding universal stress UspA family protein
MKIIVVPTDFSPPAEEAMLYAGRIAGTIGGSMLLFHAFQIPVSMSDVPVLMISVEELRTSVDAGLQKAKELLQSRYPDLKIETESRPGDVTDELNLICKARDPFAIVTGKHGATGIEHVLFGSTSLSIVRGVNTPVIIVSPGSSSQQVKQIGLAIDLADEGFPAEKIKGITAALGARLHIVHVENDKSGKMAFNGVPGLTATYTTIQDNEFVHGIASFIEQRDIDLLIILPHRHNFIERWFSKTHTPELIQKLSIPVMCIKEA